VQPDSFYFNVIPFAEDVREFQFPSFSSFPASCQPNKQQLESAANFIKMLDLAPDGKKEILLPDFTPNPVLAVVHFPCYLVYLKVNHLIYPIMYKLV
jgi:ATP-dependent DNA helicase 2 subunit 2